MILSVSRILPLIQNLKSTTRQINYAMIKGGAGHVTLISVLIVGAVLRKVKIIINGVNPIIQAVSWLEISDF